MLYAVYITRASHWSFEDRERVPIHMSEWLAYAQAIRNFCGSIPCPGYSSNAQRISVPVENTWEWVAHPQGRNSEKLWTFESIAIVCSRWSSLPANLPLLISISSLRSRLSVESSQIAQSVFAAFWLDLKALHHRAMLLKKRRQFIMAVAFGGEEG